MHQTFGNLNALMLGSMSTKFWGLTYFLMDHVFGRNIGPEEEYFTK